MDPVGAPYTSSDVHSPTQRQSILGSFLRVRPRGSSQSHQAPPQLPVLVPAIGQDDPSSPREPATTTVSPINMAPQPPSPGPGHRRRPAAANMQTTTPSNLSGGALSQILRRRRSANGALSSAHPPTTTVAPAPAMDPSPPALPTRPATSATPASNARAHRIRLVPHLDSNRSLHFEPITRDVREGDTALRIGRFTDRSGMGVAALNAQNTNKLAFKSKVVSRAHAEVWCEPGGKFFIKDTKSSSGTFLNHVRLAAPNTESRPFPIKDGDVLQLGVDYQGGTEEIYKCVKIRIELGREWQAAANAFNTNALKQLKALSVQPVKPTPGAKPAATKNNGLSDCCICLFCVTVHQSLFIAPCSHVFHYKCIRPMLELHHPGFSCPLCRTFANLEEDVEVELDADFAGGDSDNASAAEDTGVRGPPTVVAPPQVGISRTAVSNDAMDVDAEIAGAILAAAAQNAAGPETDVERDSNVAGETLRNRAAGGSLGVRQHRRRGSPPASHIDEHGVLLEEDLADDFDIVEESGVEFDDVESVHVHSGGSNNGRDEPPLPPLPVPAPSGSGGLSASPSPPIGIARPMSAPLNGSNINIHLTDIGVGVSNMNMRPPPIALVDEFSDGEGDGYMRDMDGSGGSSGDGENGPIGPGGKRKR